MVRPWPIGTGPSANEEERSGSGMKRSRGHLRYRGKHTLVERIFANLVAGERNLMLDVVQHRLTIIRRFGWGTCRHFSHTLTLLPRAVQGGVRYLTSLVYIPLSLREAVHTSRPPCLHFL